MVSRPEAWALAAGAACVAITMSLVHAQGLAQGADAKACALLPSADLEAYYGSKAATPSGINGASLSTCNVMIGGHPVKLQVSPPGAVGVPTSVQTGLLAGTAMLKDAKKGPLQLIETKDFGKVGCFTTKASSDLAGAKAQKPIYATTCFVVEGGYLNLALADEDAARVTLDIVRQFTEKAAARRK
jgi:hypothetical protein